MSLPQPYQQIKKILDLSLSLAKVKFKLRNEGSYLGIFWYLLEPLSAFAILLLLGGALSQHNIIDHYPIYLFIGIIIFNFFRAVSTLSIGAVVSNAGFIKSMKIAQEPFVISGLIQYLFSHLFELLILVALMLYSKMSLIGLVAYPIILLFLCLFTLGLSFILATVGVFIRDMTNVWGIVMRLLWFGTPIFYTVKKATLLHTANLYNPLFYFILAVRDTVIDQKLPAETTLAVIFWGSIISFGAGLWIFIKYKNKFAEKL